MAHTCSLSTAMGASVAAAAGAPFFFFFALPEVFSPFLGFPIADSSVTQESRKHTACLAFAPGPYNGWQQQTMIF